VWKNGEDLGRTQKNRRHAEQIRVNAQNKSKKIGSITQQENAENKREKYFIFQNWSTASGTQLSSVKVLRRRTVKRVKQLSRGGRVVNARALRARGSRGPQGFESLPRRHLFY
jgi:hypothetical protein